MKGMKMTAEKIDTKMVTLVTSQEQANMIGRICSEACKLGDLNVAKMAVLIAESIAIAPERKESAKKTTPEETEQSENPKAPVPKKDAKKAVKKKRK